VDGNAHGFTLLSFQNDSFGYAWPQCRSYRVLGYGYKKIKTEDSLVRPVAVYYHNLSQSGGAERMACALASELSCRGRTVHLVSWNTKGMNPFYTLTPSVSFSPLGTNKGWFGKIRKTLRLWRYLRDNRIHTLIGFVMSGDKSVYFAAKMAGIKIIVAERNAPVMYALRQNRLERALIMRMLGAANRITVQFSDYVKGYPDALHSRIRVIQNPVQQSTHVARPAEARKGRFTLLALNRLDDFQKQVICLVEAFAEIAGEFPNWDLKIVGDGPDRELVAQKIIALGMEDRIILIPEQRSVHNSFQLAHLFVIPSRWEGFPNALAEAMSYGLPPIGFEACSGVSNLIIDGDSGWLVPGNGDSSLLAQTLGRAMESGLERERRGRSAREMMKQFDPAAQYDLWESLLDEIECESSK
jgi:GalNAc-alpha-(1->4)-GalNAc-alpha-(1->3)-diNAcBac-PP-undecaprenol alpha-1,4-N-acetyl-D-galactosaminyltransferase